MNLAELITAPRENREGSGSNLGRFVKIGVFITALITIFAFQGHSIIQFPARFFVRPIRVPTPFVWHAVYELEKSGCAKAEAVQCLFRPSEETLWHSPFLRSDRDHVKRVEARRGSSFALGLTIPRETLERAIVAGAPYLMLGFVLGPHATWINGIQVMRSEVMISSTPIILNLSAWRGQDVRIGLIIDHLSPSVFPDLLMGGDPEGFTTYDEMADVLSRQTFRTNNRSMILAIVHLIIACVFFLLWIIAEHRQEYWFFACYLLAIAFNQLIWTLSVVTTLPSTWFYPLRDTGAILQMVFGLMLGVSFARTRTREWLGWAGGAAVLYMIAIWQIKSSQWHLARMGEILSIGLPMAFAIGAALCCLQGVHLWKMGRPDLRTRMNRLFLVAGLLLIMAVVYALEGGGVVIRDHQEVWYQVIHFGLLGVIGSITLLDLREQEKLVNSIYLPSFRRRSGNLSLKGVFVQIDLKSSVVTARHNQIRYSDLLLEWATAMIQVIWQNGGDVVFERGDELGAFFQDGKSETIEKLVSTIKKDTLGLHRELSDYLSLDDCLHFRMTALRGDLIPFKKMVGKREIQFFDSAILLRSARLLECEKKIPDALAGSSIIIPCEDKILVEKIEKSLRKCSVPDKDAQIREFYLDLCVEPGDL